jgi:1-acyl-sn-glycerol-3-phosphate acyltransferase
MKTYFPGDSYQTPTDRARPLLRLLSGIWRWFFYPQYFGEAVRSSLEARIGNYTAADWAASSYRVMRIIERNGGRFDIRGLSHIRNAAEQGPFVFISNHMSTLETQIYPVIIVPFMPVTFVVKSELMTHPFLGPLLRTRDPIPVERKNARDDLMRVLTEGQARLERGVSLIIYPQSTRTPEFNRQTFNSLGTKLAAAAGVRAVPIAIKSDFWGERGAIRGFGKIRPDSTIHIEFGEPIEVAGRGRKEHEHIVSFIESRLRAWGAVVRSTSETQESPGTQ